MKKKLKTLKKLLKNIEFFDVGGLIRSTKELFRNFEMEF